VPASTKPVEASANQTSVGTSVPPVAALPGTAARAPKEPPPSSVRTTAPFDRST
jgi:hypothetical protein